MKYKTSQMKSRLKFAYSFILCLNLPYLLKAFKFIGRQGMLPDPVADKGLINSAGQVSAAQKHQPCGIILAASSKGHSEIAGYPPVYNNG